VGEAFHRNDVAILEIVLNRLGKLENGRHFATSDWERADEFSDRKFYALANGVRWFHAFKHSPAQPSKPRWMERLSDSGASSRL
jgi:hypothetical protein